MATRRQLRALLLISILALAAASTAAAQPAGDTAEPDAMVQARALMDREDWRGAEDVLSRMLWHVPENTEAHYLRGIALRKLGSPYTIMGDGRWSRSGEDFEAVLATDSLYRDVLYQYALLERADQQYARALDLADAQLRIKPDLSDARAGALLLYRDFALFASQEKVSARRTAHPSAFSEYAWAEALRHAGDLKGAVVAFYEVLKSEDVPKVGALLGLARTYYAMGMPETAQGMVEKAIAGIRSAADARLLFDDFQYVFSPAEMAQYDTLSTPEEYRAFFRGFWARRDPAPGEPVNARLAEHYERLAVAEREYAFPGPLEGRYEPYRDALLHFPGTYRLNSRLNDMGIVYVRYGEPDDRVDVSGNIEGRRRAEFWRYTGLELYFHFEKGALHNGWRLVPFPQFNPDVFAALESWGGVYAFTARKLGPTTLGQRRAPDIVRGWHDHPETFPEEVREFGEVSDSSIAIALTTDRYTPPEPVAPMQLVLLPAAFRGEDGRTEVTFYYALPVGQIAERASGADSVDVEVGLTLRDAAWKLDGSFTDVKPLPNVTSDDPTAALVDLFSVLVQPDSYHVALHASAAATGQAGTFRLDTQAPDLSGPGLRMSSLVPAYAISEALSPGRFTRGDLYLHVNPFRVFSVTQSVFTYFEVYGLTLGSDGLARYEAAYTLRPAPGGEAVLTFKTEGSGPASTLAASSELDPKNVAPGDYVLQVTVTDQATGKTVSQSLDLTLTE
ncbi:MAG TPA: GWxTD domain-containing protein [Rhodothermales bacterium]|nr:GWxTD domain-containing protein [Rhodothermales bacterium]